MALAISASLASTASDSFSSTKLSKEPRALGAPKAPKAEVIVVRPTAELVGFAKSLGPAWSMLAVVWLGRPKKTECWSPRVVLLLLGSPERDEALVCQSAAVAFGRPKKTTPPKKKGRKKGALKETQTQMRMQDIDLFYSVRCGLSLGGAGVV